MKQFLIASAFAALASTASASTLTFVDFTSTNPSQLNPTVTIDNSVANQFVVSIMLGTGEAGTLGGVFFDISGLATNVNGLTYTAGAPNAAALSASNFSVVTNAGGFDAGNINSGQCTNNTNLNGLSGLPNFEVGVCYNSTGNPSSRPTNGLTTVSFTLTDTTAGFLTLEQFAGVGLRYQQSSNGGGSDKLFSSTLYVPPAPVPLPAAGWLLLAGVGGIAAMARRRRNLT